MSASLLDPPILMERAFTALVIATLALVLYRAVIAATRSGSLLQATPGGDREQERMGMLAATLAAAGAYAAQCLSAMSSPDLRAMPVPTDWVLWLAGGGQATFLTGKLLRLRKGEDE